MDIQSELIFVNGMVYLPQEFGLILSSTTDYSQSQSFIIGAPEGIQRGKYEHIRKNRDYVLNIYLVHTNLLSLRPV